MKQANVDTRIRKREAQTRRDRQLRNLTESLAKLLHLAERPGIQAPVGKGTERLNLEALSTWVQRHAREIESLRSTGSDPLDYLYAKFLSDFGSVHN